MSRYTVNYSYSTPPHLSPFSKTVVSAVQTLYPPEIADQSFDNTGLLLEAPFYPDKPTTRTGNKVLLTIDLSTAVADEAIELGVQIVVAYRESMFKNCPLVLFVEFAK